MAGVTVAWDCRGSGFDDEAAATLKRATAVFWSATMHVVGVVARNVLAKQHLSIVLRKLAIWAMIGEATAFWGATSLGIVWYAASSGTVGSASKAYVRATIWAFGGAAWGPLLAASTHVRVTARPMRAMNLGCIRDLDHAAWAREGTAFASLSAAQLVVCVVAIRICAHD